MEYVEKHPELPANRSQLWKASYHFTGLIFGALGIPTGSKLTTNTVARRMYAIICSDSDGQVIRGTIQKILATKVLPKSVRERCKLNGLVETMTVDGIAAKTIAKIAAATPETREPLKAAKKRAAKKRARRKVAKVAVSASPKTRAKRAAAVEIIDDDDAETVDDFSGMTRAELIAILTQ